MRKAYLFLALSLLGEMSYGHEQSSRKSDDFLFEVQPRTVAPGETAVLHWSIKGAASVLIEESSESNRELRALGRFGGSGTLQVHPREDTTYVITCEGSTTHTCASTSVRVRIKKH